jgi:hypothetical protein
MSFYGQYLCACSASQSAIRRACRLIPAAAFRAVFRLTIASVLFTFDSNTKTNAAAVFDDINAGPIFSHYTEPSGSGINEQALGPFFYYETSESQRTWAVPPLVSRNWDPVADFDRVDVGYPLLTYRRFGTEYRWQLLQWLNFNGGANQQGQEARRFTLFPIYFQQRSPESNQNYTAVFPFYGHLKHRIFRDDIYFVMFPLYSRTRKRDVITENYLYPFFSLRHGGSMKGWKAWPIAGHERKDPTTSTNGFGDVEVVPGRDGRFVLWPFYLQQRTGIGTETPGYEQALIPFYSYTRSKPLDSTTILWPFITHVNNREQGYRAWEVPWPLIVFARGEGKNTSRVWPFFGHAQTTNAVSSFFLWPVYKYNHVEAGALDLSRTRIFFFLYSDKVERNTGTGKARERRDLWPLFTRSKDFSGATRLQVFAPLEPYFPGSVSIERDYSPLWSFWISRNDPQAQTSSQSLLWNLYHHQAAPRSAKTSALFGLYQYESETNGNRMRLFYIPVLKSAPKREESQGHGP